MVWISFVQILIHLYYLLASSDPHYNLILNNDFCYIFPSDDDDDDDHKRNDGGHYHYYYDYHLHHHHYNN